MENSKNAFVQLTISQSKEARNLEDEEPIDEEEQKREDL